MKEINLLIVGVGGQGTLLTSKILGNLALKAGLDVKLSEVHGMAQRGGSVVTHVRISDQPVYAPVIDRGGADYILAFEMMEAMRWVSYLKKDGKIFINAQKIYPLSVMLGKDEYPDNVVSFFQTNVQHSCIFDAEKLAIEAGSPMAVNTVLLGALAKELPFEKSLWMDEIAETVKPRFVALNQLAFEKGYNCNAKEMAHLEL